MEFKIYIMKPFFVSIAAVLLLGSCSSKDTTQRDIADLILFLTEKGNATIIFNNEKTDPSCDYELEISKDGSVTLNVPATATGTTSSPRQIAPGTYDFVLHCDATGAQIQALSNQVIQALKTYELHAEVTSNFELNEVK